MSGPSDIALRGWGAVTVRVAWTLASRGVTLGPDVLRDARNHVWLHLDPDAEVDAADDRAEPLTHAFVAHAYGKVHDAPYAEDVDHPLPRPWRVALHEGLSANANWVLRMHYADNHPLEVVSARLGEDLLALEAVRDGLRELAREIARQDDDEVEDWADDRLDHLIHRLASLPWCDGPPLLEVVDGLHPDHLPICVRSARAYQLVRRGLLKRADLVAPHGAARPHDRVTLVALHFDAVGRRHRGTLASELGGRVFPVGETLLVDASDLAHVGEVLQLAAQVEAPARDHLRGAVLEGPGVWSRHGLVGPLVEEARDAVRSVPWGMVDDVGELPPPLPAPPSARNAWLAVAALAVATVVVLGLTLTPSTADADHPLEVTLVPARQGVWVDFDVDEDAYVVVLRAVGDQVDVVLDSRHVMDKVRHATGDGAYRLHTLGDGVLIASTSRPVPDLDGLALEASGRPQPLAFAADRIRDRDPRADVRVQPR